MTHEKYAELLRIVHDCAAACNHCFVACLNEEDVNMMSGCIRLDRECADVCAFMEQAISRNSPFISQMAALCAEICEACGNECSTHADHHDHCRRCAEACFKCAEACKRIA
ncbi:four-helix bundle copper-binding protein [Jeotgalibacillus campisalis]|uniref:four-helix bundle copper-binding protein n=1 Tax=Jeotgalibacillus campisalis TaxID=220754 RepID=UPI000596E3DC|nr:four-helix bundle copper-binding protein [Jeotgalibacillus campisalis]